MSKNSKKTIERVVGLDLGDRWTYFCVLSKETGERLEKGRVRTTPEALLESFGNRPKMRMALEVGTHSPWIDRLLKGLGHQVIVSQAGKVEMIYRHSRKNDRRDAESLARLARLDPELLSPMHHRSESAQCDLAVVRSRETLVKARTQLINSVRGSVKSLGYRLPSCSAESFVKKTSDSIPEPLLPALAPVLETIELLTHQIRGFNYQIEELCRSRYPETERLRQVRGVGAITALSFVLVLEDPSRFERSRTVGAFLGLVPRQDDSGDSSPQLRITKQGDELLRRLLVMSSHYILGPFGKDCDLRRHGERICERGGKTAKKKAAVAVARKLAVLLHRLWVTGQDYDPFYTARRHGDPVPEVQAA